MTRRAILAESLLACMMAIPLAMLVASPANAAKTGVSRQGWWSVDATGNKTVDALTNPDVPASGLLVQGNGTSNPVAFAALAYSLPKHTAASSLTMTVTSASVSTATPASSELEVCPLSSPNFKAAQGGAFSASPAYSCKHHVTAKPKSGTTTYHFSLQSLHAKGAFGIAILPTSTPSRVVFDKPTGTSLAYAKTVVTKAPTPKPSFSTAPASSPPSSSTSSGTGPSGGGGGAGDITPPSGDSSVTAPDPAQSPDVAPQVSTTPSLAAAPAVAAAQSGAGGSGHSNVAIAVIAGLVGLAAVLWLLAGSRDTRSPTP